MSRDYTAPPPMLRDVLTGEQACKDAGGLFFNDADAPKETEAGRIAAAKALCHGDAETPACPVFEDCRHYALHRETSGGVWGGMSYKQIKAMRRELGIRAEPPADMQKVFAMTPEERAAAESRRNADRWYPGKDVERNREYRERVAARRAGQQELVDELFVEDYDTADQAGADNGRWAAA